MREDYTRLMYQTAAVAADLVTYGMGAGGGYKRQSYFVCTRCDVTRLVVMTCEV